MKDMADGEKRSCSRLLIPENLRSNKVILALPANCGNEVILALPANCGNTTRRGKKRINEDIESTQVAKEVGKKSAGKLMDNQTDRVINYLLDMLEAKDTHELFAMPYNFQTFDYEESINQPGNFAIIRQKHRDRMYPTMEAFENDILMLFAKAIEASPPNSLPYREAMDLRKHAKKVFQSLKNNPTHEEFELSRWLQTTVGTSSNAASRGRPRTRRAIPEEDESPQFPEEQRRNTYKTWNDSNDSYITMFAKEPKRLVYNTDSISYVESIQNFVKSANPVAKYIAGKRCDEYTRRMQAQSVYRPSPFGSQSIASREIEFKSCELNTDELYNQLSLVENMGSSSKQEVEPELKLNRGNESNSTRPNLLPDLNLMPEMQNSPPSSETKECEISSRPDNKQAN